MDKYDVLEQMVANDELVVAVSWGLFPTRGAFVNEAGLQKLQALGIAAPHKGDDASAYPLGDHVYRVKSGNPHICEADSLHGVFSEDPERMRAIIGRASVVEKNDQAIKTTVGAGL